MTRRHLFAAVWLTGALGLGTWSCAGSLPDIHLQGARSELDALSGEWLGEYSADGPDRRRGSILFRLEAGEDHAHGDVLMQTMSPWHRGDLPPFDRWRDERDGSQFLSIHVVRVDRDRIRGVLDTYWDPDRGCWADTIFEGRLVEDTISGRFHSRFSLPLPDVEGTWRVRRSVR